MYQNLAPGTGIFLGLKVEVFMVNTCLSNNLKSFAFNNN